MTKATHRRKSPVRVYSFRELESMTVRADSMAAGKHCADAVAENWHLTHKQEAERGS